MPLPQLRLYLTENAEDLLGRLADLGTQIISMVAQIGMVEAQRHQAKLDALRESQESSVAARERASDQHAMTFTMTLYELRAELEGLYEEQRFVRLCYETAMSG